MAYQGFGSLNTVNDLYDKLQKDYQRMLRNEADPYCAFDFFVTAYHMIDWTYPNDRKRQRELEEKELLLQLCSHIANGAKHFTATAKKHTSVTSVRVIKKFNAGYVSEGVYQSGYASQALQVELDGEAEEKYGQSIMATTLACHLLKFWREKLYPQTECEAITELVRSEDAPGY